MKLSCKESQSTITSYLNTPPQLKYSTSQFFFAWIATFIGVTFPIIGVILAAILVWVWGFRWLDLELLFGMYLFVMLGTTVGFHRLFTHRSFQTSRSIQFILGALGSMSFQGPLIQWVELHRMHHQFSDRNGDPHSPYPHENNILGVFKGFWHAHIGWAFGPMPASNCCAVDLRKSAMIRLVDRLFPFWAFLGVFIPALIGYFVLGWQGAITGFLWGGLIRIFLGHHITWSVNSICHFWGSRSYSTKDQSRNNFIVGIFALGEGWHNNHHAFPFSASHGLRWWQIDISFLIIRFLAMCRLAWQIRLPSLEEINARAKQIT